MNDRIQAYLKELAEVSKKHGLFIESCDCCSKICDINGKEYPIPGAYGGIGYDEETDSY